MPTAAHALFSPSFLTHPIQSHSLPSLTHAHAHTHTLTHTRTHSLTLTHTHSHAPSSSTSCLVVRLQSQKKIKKEKADRSENQTNRFSGFSDIFFNFFPFFLSSLIVMTSSRAAAAYLSARNRQGVAKSCPKFGRT